jgi:hypothetical protein
MMCVIAPERKIDGSMQGIVLEKGLVYFVSRTVRSFKDVMKDVRELKDGVWDLEKWRKRNVSSEDKGGR